MCLKSFVIRSKEFALLDNEEINQEKRIPLFLEVTIIGFKSFICGLLDSIKRKGEIEIGRKKIDKDKRERESEKEKERNRERERKKQREKESEIKREKADE